MELNAKPDQLVDATSVVPGARATLASADIAARRRIITRAVESNLTELAPDLLKLMDVERNPNLKSRCAWALGKLNYREAEPRLITALTDPSVEVRTWAAWALGEMGSIRTEAHLKQALEREGVENVRRAIGGALKKLNFDSTRVHISQLTRALQPPKTTDSRLTALVNNLEGLNWETDADEIIKLRTAMRAHDLGFFKTYMEWLRRKPAVIAALQDDKKVFHS